jgi:hypothetical protein
MALIPNMETPLIASHLRRCVASSFSSPYTPPLLDFHSLSHNFSARHLLRPLGAWLRIPSLIIDTPQAGRDDFTPRVVVVQRKPTLSRASSRNMRSICVAITRDGTRLILSRFISYAFGPSSWSSCLFCLDSKHLGQSIPESYRV